MEYIKQKEKILIGDTGYYYNINEGSWFNPKGATLKHSPLSRIEKEFTDTENLYARLLCYNKSISKIKVQAFDLIYNFVKSTYPDKLQEYFTEYTWNYGYSFCDTNNEICQFIVDNKKLLKRFFETKNPERFFTREIANWIQDVVDEAFSQCNCVFRCYYESLIKGFTNIVFVRDKQNPKKSLITCEVTNNGDISLYLLAHNQDPKDENQIRFRVKYQAYLRGVFNND